jgi:hypothetical protein
LLAFPALYGTLHIDSETLIPYYLSDIFTNKIAKYFILFITTPSPYLSPAQLKLYIHGSNNLISPVTDAYSEGEQKLYFMSKTAVGDGSIRTCYSVLAVHTAVEVKGMNKRERERGGVE